MCGGESDRKASFVFDYEFKGFRHVSISLSIAIISVSCCFPHVPFIDAL